MEKEKKSKNEQPKVHEEPEKKKEPETNKLIDPNTLKIDQLETIKNEIKKNKKSNISKNKKKLKYKEILKNTIVFIFIQLYFTILIIGNSQIGAIRFITDLKVIILLEAVISIILFEIAFKKESVTMAFHGLEVLGMGIATVVILDLYNRQSSYLNLVFAGIITAFIVYYIIKILVILLKKKK